MAFIKTNNNFVLYFIYYLFVGNSNILTNMFYFEKLYYLVRLKQIYLFLVDTFLLRLFLNFFRFSLYRSLNFRRGLFVLFFGTFDNSFMFGQWLNCLLVFSALVAFMVMLLLMLFVMFLMMMVTRGFSSWFLGGEGLWIVPVFVFWLGLLFSFRFGSWWLLVRLLGFGLTLSLGLRSFLRLFLSVRFGSVGLSLWFHLIFRLAILSRLCNGHFGLVFHGC